MKRLFGFAVVLLVSAILGAGFGAGCGPAGQSRGDLSSRTIEVVATTGMIADAVREVGGDRVKVEALMGPGVDPHGYETKPRDQQLIENADVIFYNGLHLEGKMNELFEQMAKRRPTIAVSDGVPKDQLLEIEEFAGGYDPHIWHDVAIWKHAVGHVRDSLVKLDPKHAEQYKKNADRYLGELTKLHEEVKEKAAALPEAQRVMVTAHDAFNYFGRAYGFKVHGLQGVSTEAEASVADVQRLVKFIADNKVPAIFVESTVNPENMKSVRDAVAARGIMIAIVGESPEKQLLSDALGNKGTPAADYAGMIHHNIDTVVKGLQK